MSDNTSCNVYVEKTISGCYKHSTRFWRFFCCTSASNFEEEPYIFNTTEKPPTKITMSEVTTNTYDTQISEFSDDEDTPRVRMYQSSLDDSIKED